MRILLFSSLYRPEPTGIGPITGALADSLAENGHEVTVIAANPSYPYWKLFPGYKAWRWSSAREGAIDVHRCPLFIPSKVGGISRILHYSSFAASALFPATYLARKLRPDLVMLVAPTLLAAPIALLTAKLAGAISWLHVQDFEVEAGFATGQMNSGGTVARAALAFERTCVKRFNQTSSISPAMCRKLVEKGRSPKSVYELRNWANSSGIVPQKSSIFRERWNIRTPHVVLYSGSIAKKQGIEIIIDVARRCQHRDDITFILCGSGPTRPALEALAADLENIQFHDLQPLEDLGELLNLATMHLLPQRADAADLVLPSKLANMLASGRPVIAGAAAGRDLAHELEGCGIAVEPENAQAMTDAVMRLADDPDLYGELAGRAPERVKERWDRETIIRDFENHLQAITQ